MHSPKLARDALAPPPPQTQTFLHFPPQNRVPDATRARLQAALHSCATQLPRRQRSFLGGSPPPQLSPSSNTGRQYLLCAPTSTRRCGRLPSAAAHGGTQLLHVQAEAGLLFMQIEASAQERGLRAGKHCTHCGRGGKFHQSFVIFYVLVCFSRS